MLILFPLLTRKTSARRFWDPRPVLTVKWQAYGLREDGSGVSDFPCAYNTFILAYVLLLHTMPLLFAEVRLNPRLSLEPRLSRVYHLRLIPPW